MILRSLGFNLAFAPKSRDAVAALYAAMSSSPEVRPDHDVGVEDPMANMQIIEVAFENDMWWSIPPEMSMALYEKHLSGQDAGYTWDWGESRKGSWDPSGEETSINRYILDFTSMTQKNIDNGRLRSFRVVWVQDDQRRQIPQA